jgi:hypothetical protein
MIRRCIACGCTDLAACEMPDGSACAWVADDLCSACVDEADLEPAPAPASLRFDPRRDFDFDPRK